MPSNPEIVLFHYPFSPYARRIIWYLLLRRIPYSQCLQPPVLPRPDVASLGVSYRRIPLLSINGDVYLDTRLILSVLADLFPTSSEHPALPESPMSSLLQSLTVEAGLFPRAAQLMPLNLPILSDKGFLKDREDYTSTSWSASAIAQQRPEALAAMRVYFALYEKLLSDDRQWLDGTEQPSMADLHGVWPLDWMYELKSLDAQFFSKDIYPKTYAWIERWRTMIKSAKKKGQKRVKTIKGDEVLRVVTSGGKVAVQVEQDPLALEAGQEVQVWPTDSGSNHRDSGQLVGLSRDEVVVAVTATNGKTVHVHAPRIGFRIKAAQQAQAKL